MENTFYVVEECIDGFGADTWVRIAFKTRKEAENYISKEYPNNKKLKRYCDLGCAEIVECHFGEEIEQIYD